MIATFDSGIDKSASCPTTVSGTVDFVDYTDAASAPAGVVVDENGELASYRLFRRLQKTKLLLYPIKCRDFRELAAIEPSTYRTKYRKSYF